MLHEHVRSLEHRRDDDVDEADLALQVDLRIGQILEVRRLGNTQRFLVEVLCESILPVR